MPVPSAVYWYYMAEIAIYVSCSTTCITFHRPSIIHHSNATSPNKQTNELKQVHESIYLGIEARRKDFKEYCVHHFATLSLLAGSYCWNFTRIGALVAVVHDAADRSVGTSVFVVL